MAIRPANATRAGGDVRDSGWGPVHQLWPALCHVLDDASSGYPNLLRLTPAKHAIFDEIVLRGALAGRGMANFSQQLSEPDAHAIHAFLIDRAYAMLPPS